MATPRRRTVPLSPRLEVHEHTFVSGPRSNGRFIKERQQTTSTFAHAHEGGDQPHGHPDTGPATYTQRKKKYTAKPTGEQLPWEELEDWQKSFTVIVCDPPPGFVGEGGGLATAARMVTQFKMRAHVIDGRKRRA